MRQLSFLSMWMWLILLLAYSHYAEKAKEAAEASHEAYEPHLGYVLNLFGGIYLNQGKFAAALLTFEAMESLSDSLKVTESALEL